MTRHPTARRVHREDAAPDDKFVAGVLETTAWAQQHGRRLLIGGIVAVVVVVGLVVFLQARANKREQAATQLTQVRALAMSGNAQLAARDLETFLANFGGTPAEAEARLLLGRAYLDMDSTSRAIATVQPLAGDLDQVTGVNAAFLVAGAHEAAGNTQEAEEVYRRIGRDAEFLYQRQEGLDNAARLRLQAGDYNAALQLYQELIEMTPETAAEYQVYQLRLGEVRALAAGGAASGNAATPGATEPAGTGS
jgi:predicted negative regulator of RcsB-dependent stress response